MKKFLVLSLVGLLILAFGTAYAQEKKEPVLEFKASGFIDVISEYVRNVPQPGAATSASGGTSTNNVVYGPPTAYMMPAANQAFDKKMAYMENRGRLRFDALMGKEMSGTFFFEFDSTRWGERIPAGSTAQRQYAGFWGVADRSALELKGMWLTFGMPWIPIPTTIQAGIHPMAIRPSVFLATDGPGVTAAFKIDPATIKLIWAKALENRDWAADDDDVYAIEASAKIETFTVGGYWALFNFNSYPHTTEGAPSYRADVWWAGLYADGKLGPVNLNFDFVYDKGTIEDRRQNVARGRDVDLSGWGALVNVGFPWEKFLFGFSTIYGTGADQKKTAATPLPGAATPWGTTTDKVKAFLVPGGTEGTVGHSLILCGAGINRMNTGFEPAADYHSRASFGGLWINKLYGAFTVSPEFTTRLEAMYIRDTTKNGNTIGNALTAAGRPRDDKSIGWEIDWFNTLKLYKNLTFEFGGGILFAGDAMDYRNTATNTNESPKNPWVITTKLMYSF